MLGFGGSVGGPDEGCLQKPRLESPPSAIVGYCTEKVDQSSKTVTAPVGHMGLSVAPTT